MSRKTEVGDSILTVWDDTDKMIPAVILRYYRGHRTWRYEVEMIDGTTEIIDEDQIVG